MALIKPWPGTCLCGWDFVYFLFKIFLYLKFQLRAHRLGGNVVSLPFYAPVRLKVSWWTWTPYRVSASIPIVHTRLDSLLVPGASLGPHVCWVNTWVLIVHYSHYPGDINEEGGLHYQVEFSWQDHNFTMWDFTHINLLLSLKLWNVLFNTPQ